MILSRYGRYGRYGQTLSTAPVMTLSTVLIPPVMAVAPAPSSTEPVLSTSVDRLLASRTRGVAPTVAEPMPPPPVVGEITEIFVPKTLQTATADDIARAFEFFGFKVRPFAAADIDTNALNAVTDQIAMGLNMAPFPKYEENLTAAQVRIDAAVVNVNAAQQALTDAIGTADLPGPAWEAPQSSPEGKALQAATNELTAAQDALQRLQLSLITTRNNVISLVLARSPRITALLEKAQAQAQAEEQRSRQEALSHEQQQQQMVFEAEAERLKRRRMYKWIGIGVGGFLVVIGGVTLLRK